MKSLTSAILVLALSLPCFSQTREQGPWWPSQWGADDQAGASNRITAATILKAVQLVKTGKMYELGQVYERGMPLFGERTYAMFIPGSPTGGPFGENNMLMYHDEFLCAEIGQVGHSVRWAGPHWHAHEDGRRLDPRRVLQRRYCR